MPNRVPTHRPAHADQARRDYEASRQRREDRRFYNSAAWRACRARVLADEPLCRDCQAAGIIKAAEQVHHELERKDRPDLAFARSNLTPLCLAHHNARR